ncbi:MAG TPA: hypothetical protein V6C95_23805 [Coleofasciculaceae cyanobacterium]
MRASSLKLRAREAGTSTRKGENFLLYPERITGENGNGSTTHFNVAMSPSLPTGLQPEPENKCPDCLYLKLDGIPVQPTSQDNLDFWPASTHAQTIDLYLTVHFNEQWESLQQGRFKFGLRGGELRIKMENSEIPYEFRQLIGSFELSQHPQRQSPKGRVPQKPSKGQSHSGNSGTPKTPVQEPNSKETEPVPVNICHITTKISEENPTWVFEEEMGGLVLKGVLEQVKLATVTAIAFPCRVEATFEVSKRDVCLTDAEGLWPPDLSRNKQAILARLIIQRLLEPKLKPYLSRAELHYD